ncbi:MAG: prepilin peptidase [bacterium]|nr:prepilin peptidase [bacterium]
MNNSLGLIVFGFVLGTILGSLAKALADRSTKKVSFWGRSYCLSCKRKLAWYDLFPVLSYLLLKGRCRYCHKKIPSLNLGVEIVLGVTVAFIFASTPSALVFPMNFTWDNVSLLLDLLFKIFTVVVLAVVFLTDLKTGLIPDRITYPAVLISAAYILVSLGLKIWTFYQSILSSPFGSYLLPPRSHYFSDVVQRLVLNKVWDISWALGMALLFVLLIVVTKGRGMGWGDVKFVLFLGLALGFPQIMVALLLAFLLGAVFSLGLIALGRKSFGQTIPFGPFLSLGAVLAFLWAPQILNLYFSSFKLGY